MVDTGPVEMDRGAAESTDRASAHLEVSLIDRPTTRLRAAVRWVLSIVLSIAGGGPEDGAADVDLRVTRRETGREVLRIPGGTLSVADAMLHRIRADLQTMSVTQFLAEWSPAGAPSADPPGSPDGPSAGAS